MVVFSLAGMSCPSSARAVAAPSLAATAVGWPLTGAIDTPTLSGIASSSAGGRSSANGCGNGWQEASSATKAKAAHGFGRSAQSEQRADRKNAKQTDHSEPDILYIPSECTSRIIPLPGLGNGNSPLLRGKGDCSRRLTAPQC